MAFMGTSSERVFNGFGRGYLRAGTIDNRTHILSERLKAGTEFKRQKRGIDLRRCPLRVHIFCPISLNSVSYFAASRRATSSIKMASPCLAAAMLAAINMPIAVM